LLPSMCQFDPFTCHSCRLPKSKLVVKLMSGK